jgi:hypothetical protein|tara:strand:- start:48 stop:680 length:633 start_codon:yes stop_codon:yes gene_type:complete
MYFNIVPNIAYDQKPISFPFSESDYIVAKNFFRRYKLNDDIFSQAVYFKKYAVEDGERPDTIAKKVYGNPYYDWVILLTNNVINAQYDWPLSGYDLAQVIESNFDDPYSEIRHYEIREDIGTYTKGLRVDKTFYDGQHKLNIGGSIITKNGNEIASPVTIADYYHYENEKKREIYLLREKYFRGFVADFRKQNLYKDSKDFVTKRLKQTG